MKTIMENRDTGQIKAMKIGFSWTLLLFACFFGLPLFLRRLYGWGVVFLAILAVNFFVPSMINVPADRAVVQVFISLIALCMVLFIAIKGNEITAKHYLENGWTFVEPDSAVAILAKRRWGISEFVTPNYRTNRFIETDIQPQDYDQQLRRLAKLKEDGIISAEEFDKKKYALLGL